MKDGARRSRPWLTRGAVGICVATFFSDVGHEMATAVLPLYLGTIGVGPAALGLIEGLADAVFALAKFVGGLAGQHIRRKSRWTAAGYALTALGTAGIALARLPAAIGALRAVAWGGRGFRSPLRDFLLADEVEPTHFGRAYGLERAADMAGAVAGPLVAILLVAGGLSAGEIIAWTLLPASIPILTILLFVRDRQPSDRARPRAAPTRLPGAFWRLIGAVSLFGVSDFSRTFLVLLAARALGDPSASDGFAGFGATTLTFAVGIYALHNAISACAALGIGHLADRLSKPRLLAVGYGLGALTHATLAFGSGSLPWLLTAVVLSGVYVAAEETLEKAACAELVPRAVRSRAFGFLAAANSVGDLVASVAIGLALQHGFESSAFAAFALLAAVAALLAARVRPPPLSTGLVS